MNEIYKLIIESINLLVGKRISYISGRNELTIIAVDDISQRIKAQRKGEEISIPFSHIEELSKNLATGTFVDVNEVWSAGGNVRAAVEAIAANLPNVGYYKGNTKFNKSPHKKIVWFDDPFHLIGTLADASEIEPSIQSSSIDRITLPKPFLLLAGISGTGKSRFVREQAQRHGIYPDNFKSVAVRPDWHEPSDLLGYVTRISGKASYVVPELLKFIVSAWKNAASGEDAITNTIQYHSTAEMVPYWLCLDEMNLAPVEQYFADYLSVLESRKWEAGNYSCDALLSKEVIASVDDPLPLRTALGLDGHSLWDYFCKNGIPLPPNLIVAGTVNMDETTHGFSRKVIDRAFTIDFGAFYPNDLDQYFAKTQFAKTLSFPLLSAVTQLELAEIKDTDGNAVDANGVKSIAFLADLNSVLKDTPFELAYRALNELLMAVVCFQPKNEQELLAVWDDFLMTKVLPRIDGDVDKLKDRTPDADKSDPDASLLKQLETVLEQQLKMIWNDAESRPDLLRVDKDDKPFNIVCRAKKKLKWMRDRLKDNGFTTFWP